MPAACSRASASSSWSSGSGITQRRCSFGADVGPVRRLDAGQPGGRAWRRSLACSSEAVGGGPLGLLDVGDPEARSPSCTVTSSDVAGRPGPAAAGPRRAGRSGRPGRARTPAPCSSTAPRSRAGSPKLCCTCSPSQISPLSRTIAGTAIGSSEQSTTLRSRVVLQGQRRGRGRHQLAQRDDVALRRQPLEGPVDERRRRAARRAVARLVALARAARAGLARADLALGRRAADGSWCGTSWP